jgi:hypothetical protein
MTKGKQARRTSLCRKQGASLPTTYIAKKNENHITHRMQSSNKKEKETKA